MAGLLRDARFGCRALAANPTFVVLAVLSLGIGIGASAMTFTVVDDALLEPLGPVDAEGLVGLWEAHESAPNQWLPVSWPNMLDWERAVGGQARIGAMRGASFSVGPNESDARIDGAYVTDDFFAVLGVVPILGRGLQPGDDIEGSAPIVLSEAFWRERFAGDRTIVGRTVPIDGTPHTVVGVVPSLLGVGMPRDIRLARVWVPFRADSRRLARDDRSLLVIARHDAGIGIDGFAARLDDIASRLADIHRENAGWSVRVAPLGGNLFGQVRPMLLLSLGAGALLLLIACANIANLTLAYAMRRRHEFGIRAAIGASPARLATQLLSESLLVAMLGAVLGVIVARSGLDVLARLFAANTLAPVALPVDTASLVFSGALIVVTTVLVGVFPAVEVARGAARTRIGESGFGTTTSRAQDGLRRGLVVAQVAASLVLLIGAALLSRSLVNLLALDGGVETESVTSIRVESFAEPAAPDAVAGYVGPMLEALVAIPGVELAAATSHCLPMRGCGLRSRVGTREALQDSNGGPVIAYTGATPGFFDALEIPLLRGEGLGGAQRRDVAVINESLASLLWPNQNPVGQQFRLDADPQRGWITVAGVSGDFLTWDSSRDRPLPIAYMHVSTFDTYPIFFFIRKRSANQLVSSASIVRAIESLDLPVRRIVVTPMTQVARDPFWRQRVFSLWFTVFGIAALTLTAIGIYGVLAYLVRQRGREIGIRMALGADRREVLRMVLRQAATCVGTGSIVGLAGAWGLARAMRGLLFGVEPFDVSLFVAVTALLAAIAMAASIAPAVRAARIDPNVLLRD